MFKKKSYIKPSIMLIRLDSSFTLMQGSNPDPRTVTKGSQKSSNEPFQSPFGDKPFN